MLKITNPMFVRFLGPIVGYLFAGLFAVMGLVLTADALTPPPERQDLSVIEGQVKSADRVIRRRAPVRPYDTYQQQDTYSIRIGVEVAGRQDWILVPEPRLGQQDIAKLQGARVTALMQGQSDVWELKTPQHTFFTYDDTLAVEMAGKRQSLIYGPLLLAVAGLLIWLLVRYRRA